LAVIVCLSLMMACRCLAAAESVPVCEGELIFPSEKWHNHSSCIVEAPDGSLLACWYHGSGERSADDVRIEGARKRAGQAGWSPRFEMADTPNYPDCNPVMYVDAKERLWLIWPVILDHHWESALLKYRLSSEWAAGDKGPRWEWQDVLHITPQDLGPRLLAARDQASPILRKVLDRYKDTWERAKNILFWRLGWMPRIHPVRLASGKWILPLYCDTFSISIMAITPDDGKTWQISAPLIGWGNIQASVVQRANGGLVAMMRENGITQRIRVAESSDEGMTWGPVRSMTLPNPGASVEVIRLADGHWALVYNDTAHGRHTLAVSVSDDEGQSWKWTRHLERVDREKGSFSYPSMIQTRDGMLHATYSYAIPGQGSAIKHARFSETWVQQGDPK
jgi:predicted neuraminidase